MVPVPLVAALLLLVPASLSLAPAPADPLLARAEAFLNSGDFLGNTPAGWISWGQAQLGPQAAATLPLVPLGGAVRQLYAAAGVDPSPGQIARLDAAVAALPPVEARLLGGLVAEVASAYAAQRAVTIDLDAAARGEAALARTDALATLARAQDLREAAQAFAEQARALGLRGGFADPIGLVVLGTEGNDVFARNPDNPLLDPALLVDPGGDDVDTTSAGGACPLTTATNTAAKCNGLALALRLDLGGSDTYDFVSPGGYPPVVQGSGAFGGLGILVDVEGNDTYRVHQTVTRSGGITNYIAGVSQGSGGGGVGLLVDGTGDDRYQFEMVGTRTNWAQGQGFAGLGGLGALLEGTGDDLYDTDVRCDPLGIWCGGYVQGTAIYPGVGLILDAAGNDRYRGVVVAAQEDYYSQGFGAFAGLGVQVDLLGDDDYYASATSTRGFFAVSLNCAFGTAFYAGAAAFLDLDGNDRYYDETISDNPPATMIEGFSKASASLFWDVRGDDWHEMVALGPSPMLAGRGVSFDLIDNAAIYLDTGGDDTYADPIGPVNGEDNQAWPAFGADLNLVP